ncbi:hypothetical protein BGZ76_006478, partial [Entomortierella beljakovae]
TPAWKKLRFEKSNTRESDANSTCRFNLDSKQETFPNKQQFELNVHSTELEKDTGKRRWKQSDALSLHILIYIKYVGQLEEVLSLSETLKTDASLTKLYLSINSVEDKGSLELSEVLQPNTTLTVLDMSNNID